MAELQNGRQSLYPQIRTDSSFGSLAPHLLILMSIMGVKYRFSESSSSDMILTMTFMNPIWPKFKMAATIGIQGNLGFGSLSRNSLHKKAIQAPNLAQILLKGVTL